MSFEFQGVSIDLMFVRLADNFVPANVDIFNDKILRNMDQVSVNCLKGPRDTDMIKKLIPKYENFVIVLRCIRKWAKAKGLYGNKFGYLGGINFNILVAFLCQLYPNASPSFLLVRFFRIYSEMWKWPAPIMLNKVSNEAGEVWTKDIADRNGDLMPIITPTYPAANSTANVSAETLRQMTREFKKANEMCRAIASEKGKAKWDGLFSPSDFFLAYDHYLCCHIVGSVSQADDDEEARSWIGLVESRLRFFPEYLSRLPISPIHLFPEKFSSEKGNVSVAYYIGFNRTNKGEGDESTTLHVDQCISDFK